MVKRSKADIALELKSDEQLQPTKKLKTARGPNKKHDAGHDSGTHVATKQARASKKKPAVASQSISAMLSKSVAPVGTGTPDKTLMLPLLKVLATWTRSLMTPTLCMNRWGFLLTLRRRSGGCVRRNFGEVRLRLYTR